MTFGEETAALFRRDLRRLHQELEAAPEGEKLWQSLPETGNSVGNLVLHLEGNLREYIGRLMGGIAYQRQRDLEFSSSGVGRAELIRRVSELEELIPGVIARLREPDLDAAFPLQVWGSPLSTRQFLIHLHGHFNYHLGQLDYLRRVLTGGKALELAGL